MALCVLYYSLDGHTEAMANAIAQGGGGTLLDASNLSEKDWQTLDAADAIVMGAPTYMGGLPSAFVAVIEKAATRWDKGLWRDKLAGGFSSAMHPAGDKLNTLNSLFIFASQMGMVWVGNAETGAPVVPENHGINRDGSWVGVTATVPAAGSHILSKGDLETARRYGIRMRSALDRWAL